VPKRVTDFILENHVCHVIANIAEKEFENTSQKTVSLTEPESRWMKNKKHRCELSYNIQIAVDHDHGIIL